MEYLYADGTRFPLPINFIDLLRDTLDCAVDLLAIHARATSARNELVERERLTDRAIENLNGLESAIASVVDGSRTVAERVLGRMHDAAASIVAAEKSSVTALLEQDSAAAARVAAGERDCVMRALERLLKLHELPGSEIGLNLELPAGDGPYRGSVLLSSSLGLDTMLVVDVPPGHRLARPVHAGDVAANVTVSLEVDGGLLSGRQRCRRIRLDKYFVTELGFSTGRATLGLRRKPQAESDGFDLVLTTGQVLGVEVTRIREDGLPAAEPAQRLNLDDTMAVQRLLEALRQAAFELGRHRGRLDQALLDGAQVDEVEAPAEIARRLIGMLAPYVTEIARRGSAPGELALKRDMGSGRREEIYVSKAVLVERLKLLDPAQCALFDPLGLGDGSRSGVIVTARTVPPALPATALR